MSCLDCQHFAQNPNWGGYRAGCLECQARSIAQSPAYFNAAAAKGITESYKAALQRAFQGDWITWHERVKHYAELAEKAKGKA